MRRGALTGVVPLDGVDGDGGRGGVCEDAGVARLHRDVKELHRVAAARRQQRRRRIHEPHRATGGGGSRIWGLEAERRGGVWKSGGGGGGAGADLKIEMGLESIFFGWVLGSGTGY